MNFLFRLDGAKDNDEWFDAARKDPDVAYYAGLEMKVGPGWVPDGVHVHCNEREGHIACEITLVELEPTDSQARVSARKYLPEPSSEIVQTLLQYLVRIESQCRASGDPRLQQIQRLGAALRSADQIRVKTSAFLRDSIKSLETFPLIDSGRAYSIVVAPDPPPTGAFDFRGDLVLTATQHKILARAIRILDATVRGQDHSGATLKNWLISRTQPLRSAVQSSPNAYPALRTLLTSERQRGTRVSCEPLANELAALWSTVGRQWLPESVADIVSKYWPIASRLPKHSSMPSVFEEAREIVHEGTA